jgi:hypothetical protein
VFRVGPADQGGRAHGSHLGEGQDGQPGRAQVRQGHYGPEVDDRIETLLYDAITKVSPSLPELRVESRVRASADLPDRPQLILGILDLDLRVNGDVTGETLRVARETLEHCGGSWRANKNAVLLIAPDIAGMSRARATARTLAALRELGDDKYRLARFNTEQRDQLAKRLTAAQERLPQQVTMAYRHLLLLGESGSGGAKLDQIDLGPAKPSSTIPGRVLDYLRETDRIIETTLAPAALLSARFGLLPEGTNVAELEALLGFFYRLPRLPKLANSGVLRRALAEGVEKGLFGLASGSAWDAEDAVIRFSQSIDPTEIQFQPGTWLVRAATIKELIARRQPPRLGRRSPGDRNRWKRASAHLSRREEQPHRRAGNA